MFGLGLYMFLDGDMKFLDNLIYQFGKYVCLCFLSTYYYNCRFDKDYYVFWTKYKILQNLEIYILVNISYAFDMKPFFFFEISFS